MLCSRFLYLIYHIAESYARSICRTSWYIMASSRKTNCVFSAAGVFLAFLVCFPNQTTTVVFYYILLFRKVSSMKTLMFLKHKMFLVKSQNTHYQLPLMCSIKNQLIIGFMVTHFQIFYTIIRSVPLPQHYWYFSSHLDILIFCLN